FGPLWQMHPSAMRHAARDSGSFTIAEWNGHPVGYQLTTTHYRNAHLARLAVTPRVQGVGVGGALLSHLIDSLARRGIASLSVNTQGTNMRSLNLYRMYGFTPNGNNIPCWTARLEAPHPRSLSTPGAA
ncbi:MAG: GNAT family N-acetyltransferase, partial [Anaerolineae bacterium]|nr:GNAT family N-acetyltransferase [Anaerolineae bacterium]